MDVTILDVVNSINIIKREKERFDGFDEIEKKVNQKKFDETILNHEKIIKKYIKNITVKKNKPVKNNSDDIFG